MPTLEEVKAKLKNIDGAGMFLSAKEVKALPGILWEDEEIENAVQGYYNNSQALLVATNKRILFVDKGIFSLKVEDFSYDKITTVQYETGLIFGKITIYASGNKSIIDNVGKSQAKNFSDWLRNKITPSSKKEATPDSNLSSQIEQLASLRDKGILTEEEFAAKKKQILGI
jgi:hypothetical protein